MMYATQRPGAGAAQASHAPWLLEGPLFACGGVAVVDGLADAATLAALCLEAQANYAIADRQRCDEVTSDHCDGRGGVPPRQLSTAPGGVTQDAMYHSPALHAYLSQVKAAGWSTGPDLQWVWGSISGSTGKGALWQASRRPSTSSSA